MKVVRCEIGNIERQECSLKWWLQYVMSNKTKALHSFVLVVREFVAWLFPLLVFSPLTVLSPLFLPDPATFILPLPTNPSTLSLTNFSPSTAPLVFNPYVLSIHLSVSVSLCCLCMYLYIQMYPALPISHIEESKRPVTIPAWCKKSWGHCQTHPFIVLPYRCLGKNNTPHCY